MSYKKASQPRSPSIPLSVPVLEGNEGKYVKECIDSGWVSYLGPFVTRFENALARFTGTRHAVATNSGTAALHTALLVAGIQPQDEVLVSDLTFIAPVNAISYCGAVPVLFDVEPRYWQMDPLKVERFLRQECRRMRGKLINNRSGRCVRAILPVHLLGHPCDMDAFMRLAKEFDLLVIEDVAESLGAQYKGRPLGSIGDIGCFSFNGNKIITTGGGGMITTNNNKAAAQAKYLTTQARDSAKEYIHNSIGYNYRLTNIQAAVGVAQMEKLNLYVKRKQQIALRYEDGLASIPGLILPQQAPWASSTFWIYTILIDRKRFGMTSRQLQKALEQHGIQARPLWGPIHEQKPYRHCQTYRIEIAPALFRTALSLPSSVSLTEKEQNRVIRLIRELASS